MVSNSAALHSHFSSVKTPSLLIEQKAAYTPESKWTLWEKEKSFDCAGNRTKFFGFPGRRLVATSTTPQRLDALSTEQLKAVMRQFNSCSPGDRNYSRSAICRTNSCTSRVTKLVLTGNQTTNMVLCFHLFASLLVLACANV